jgi:hypothetical protein
MSIRLAEIKQPETQAAAPAPSMPDERRSHWDKVFLDPEYFASIAKQPGIVEGAKVSMFGEDYAYRAAMIGYLSDSRQVPLEDMRTIYDAEKDSVAQKEFGKPTISSKELFDFTKKKFERDDAKRTTGDAIMQAVINRGLMDALSGGNNDHYKDTAADIEAAGDLFDEQERFKLQREADRFDMQIRQATAKYGEDAKWIFSALQQKTGASDGATLGAPGEVDMTELAARFADLPDNQQDAVFKLAGMFAKLQKTDKTFFYQVAESLGRGVGDFAERIPRNWSEGMTRGELRALESGRPVSKVNGAYKVSEYGDPTPLSAEEIEAGKAEVQKRLRVFKVQRRLRELAETDIDPLKTVTNLPAIIEEGLYGAARSLPYTAAAAVPVLGLPAVTAAIYSQNYDGIMLEHPDVDPDKAALVALASAPIEAALERLQVNTIMGRLPIFGKLVQRLKNPKQRLLTRFMLSATGVVAEQNAQEIVQNSVFPVAQMVAAAIDEDMPGYNLREGLESAPRALAVQFVALLPLSLMGLGGVYYREVARGEDYFKTADAMAKLGADAESIDRVLAEPTPEKQQAAWKEVYQAIPAEKREAAAAAVVEEIVNKQVALRSAANDANLPRLDKQGEDYTVVSPTGEVIHRTRSQDSAELMLNIARREAVQREVSETTQGITEVMAYFAKVNEARKMGEDVKKYAFQGRQNAFDEYEDAPTKEKFVSLKAAVLASTGDDVTEPEQLRNYWIDASNSGTLQDGVYRSVIRIFDGADGTKVIRDEAQDHLKRVIAEGRVSMEWVRDQLKQTIPLAQGSNADVQLKTETDADVIESFSDIALAYLYGRVKHDQVAPGLRGFLVRMARAVRDIFRRAYNLEKARVAGQLDVNWQALLAESVGIDEQRIVDAARDGRGPDGLTDDERAALQAELDADMEAEMRANMRDAGGVDILDAIKQAGGLPSATSRAVGNYANELKILRENAKGGRDIGVTGTSLSRLFKKNAPDLDNLIRDLRGMGFLDIETPSDVFEMVERRITTGKPIYGYEGRATAGVLVGNYSVSKADDAAYLAAVERGDMDEAQGMVDKAAKAAGFWTPSLGHGSSQRFRKFNFEFAGSTTEAKSAAEAFFFSDGARTPKAYAIYAAEEGPIKALMRQADQAEKRGDWDTYEKLILQAEDMEFGEEGAKSKMERRKNAVVYNVFLRGNFMELDAKGETPATLAAADDFADFDGSITAAIEKAKREGFDGVIIRNLDDAPGVVETSNHYAVFSPSNIKSADPVTRDEAGNVIPLSQRFDPSTADINYSISSQQQIARINAALAGLNRGPEGRAKIYERAREKFSSLLENNWGYIFGLRAGGAKPQDVRRTKLLQAMGELDAILSVLPPEVRGKVGGYTTLAKIGTGDKALADFFVKRIEMIDRELERVLRAEWGEAATKLFNRAKPQRNQPGQKPKGKFGKDVHDLFATLEQATEWTEEDAADHAEKLWAKINRGELDAAEEIHLQLEAELVPLFANWEKADAERRASAVTIGNAVLTKAYKAEREKIMQRRTRQDIDRFDLKQAAGVEGDKPARTKQEEKDASAAGASRAILLDLASFDQTLSYIFGENAPVVRQMVKREREADARKTDGIARRTQAFADLLTNLANGDTYAGQRLGYSFTQKSVTLKYRRPGTNLDQEYRFSQGELATITMMWMQERGREHMTGAVNDYGEPVGPWHYDADFVAAAEAELTDEMRAVRDFILKDFADGWEELNAVYSSINGINLPRIKNYSPLSVDPLMSQTAQGIDPSSGEVAGAGARSPSFLKSRGGNLAEPNFHDAIQAWQAHTMMAEHWKAYAELAADLTPVLNHRDVRNAAKVAAGSEAATMIGMRLDWMHRGGEVTAANRFWLMQFFSNAMNRMASMALFGRATTLMVQVTQLAAASTKMPTGAYLSRLGKLLSGNLKWREAFNSPLVQRRIAQQPVQVQVAMRGLFSDKPSRAKDAARWLGQQISAFDGVYTAGTYAIVYDYQRSLGMSHEQATEEAERITEEIAQPTRPGTRSMWEVANTNALMRAAFAFASDARKNVALTWFSYSKRGATAGNKALAFLIVGGVISELLRTMWRDFRDDEDDEFLDEKNWGDPMRFIAAGLTDWMYGVPVLGETAERTINAALGIHTFDRGGIFGPVKSVVPALKRTPDTVADLLSGDADWGEVMRDANAILTAMGLFNNQIAALAVLSNPAKDAMQAADAQLGPDE